MARIAKIVNNQKKRRMALKQLPLRKELRKKIRNINIPEEERIEAQKKLQKLSRNACECRVVNRCQLTGRARGVYRNFRLSRLEFRRLALRGMIPGVTKSSW